MYPEGTRFTEQKKANILKKLKQNTDAYAYAKSLDHLLPPKLGGVLRLLEINNNADVIFCAHTGFEGMAKIADFWDGKLSTALLKYAFGVFPFREIPTTNEERKVWFSGNGKKWTTR